MKPQVLYLFAMASSGSASGSAPLTDEEARRNSLVEQIATARRDRAHVERVLGNLELELDAIASSRASRLRLQPTTSEDPATAQESPPVALDPQPYDPWRVEPEEATTAPVVTSSAEAPFSVF